MGRVYIVTGANGFLGNHIVRLLEKQPDTQVRALILPHDPVQSLNGTKTQVFFDDITDPASLDQIFAVPQGNEVFVIHCAAIVYIKSKFSQKVWDVNVNGTLNVAEKSLAAGAKMVYVNSVHSIPELPHNEVMAEVDDYSPDLVHGEYAKTKAEGARRALQMVHDRGLDCCIVQPAGIIGPGDYGDSHLTQLLRELVRQKLPALVKGGYNFVDVRDAAQAIVSACDHGRSGQSYILSNEVTTIEQIARAVHQATGARLPSVMLPVWVARLGIPFCNLYYRLKKRTPLYTSYALDTLRANCRFDHSKATAELGFSPRPIDQTVADTARWLEKQDSAASLKS